MKKKLVCILLSGAMAATLLTGCSLPFEKVTAESLVESAFDKEDMKSVDMDLSLSLDADMDMSSFGTKATMNMGINLDANLKSDGDVAHMEGTVLASVFGYTVEQEMETYFDYDEGIQYDYDAESDVWTYSESDSTTVDFVSGIDTKIFNDLTLKDHKRGEDYIVTATIDYDELSELIDVEDTASIDMIGSNYELEDVKLITNMTFDEKTKDIKKISFDIETDEIEDVTINEFNMTISFNQIGGEIKVKIPKKVRENAIEADEDMGLELDDMDSGMISSGETEDYGIDDFGWECDEEIKVVQDTEDKQSNSTASKIVIPETGDSLGSFNGETFKGGFDVNKFINDGWELESDFNGIFVPATNDKYDEASLYLYGLKDVLSVEDLQSSGVWGYEMDVTYCKDKLPMFTFGGLTWGATTETIKSLYGEPDREYNYDDYDVMMYTTKDGTEVTFETHKENQFGMNGLTSVSVINYDLMD